MSTHKSIEELKALKRDDPEAYRIVKNAHDASMRSQGLLTTDECTAVMTKAAVDTKAFHNARLTAETADRKWTESRASKRDSRSRKEEIKTQSEKSWVTLTELRPSALESYQAARAIPNVDNTSILEAIRTHDEEQGTGGGNTTTPDKYLKTLEVLGSNLG